MATLRALAAAKDAVTRPKEAGATVHRQQWAVLRRVVTGGRRAGSRGSEIAGVSYAAEADEIERVFRRRLAGLRRRLRPWEIPAAVRALRTEKQLELRAARERRAVERRSYQGRAPPQPQ